VLLRGLRIDGPGALSVPNVDQVQFTNCQGLVLLEDCVGNPTSTYGGTPRLVVFNCSQLEATRCQFGNSWVTGGRADLAHSPIVLRSSSIVSGSRYGLSATACQLQLVDTAVGVYQGYPSGPAIVLQGGDLRMVGGSTYQVFNNSIAGTGTMRVDPSVVFGGVGFGSQTIPRTTMPAVVATDGPLGGSVTVTMRGPAGDLGVLFAGLPGPPLFFPGIADPSWMLPGTEVVCTATVLAAGTGSAVTYPVPNVLALRGLRIVWQGASVSPANLLQASNPAVTTHW